MIEGSGREVWIGVRRRLLSEEEHWMSGSSIGMKEVERGNEPRK